MSKCLLTWEDLTNHNYDFGASAGIYAWYICPLPPTKMATQQGDPEAWYYELNKLLSWASNSDILLDGSKTFGRGYYGCLKEERVDSEELLKRYEDNIKKTGFREKVDQLLRECFPVAYSPIYIGRTNNLNDRIYNHIRAIEEGTETTSDNDAEEFADRVHEAGVSLDYLVLQAVEGENENDVLKVVELLLNRFSAPIYGKR